MRPAKFCYVADFPYSPANPSQAVRDGIENLRQNGFWSVDGIFPQASGAIHFFASQPTNATTKYVQRWVSGGETIAESTLTPAGCFCLERAISNIGYIPSWHIPPSAFIELHLNERRQKLSFARAARDLENNTPPELITTTRIRFAGPKALFYETLRVDALAALLNREDLERSELYRFVYASLIYRSKPTYSVPTHGQPPPREGLARLLHFKNRR